MSTEQELAHWDEEATDHTDSVSRVGLLEPEAVTVTVSVMDSALSVLA